MCVCVASPLAYYFIWDLYCGDIESCPLITGEDLSANAGGGDAQQFSSVLLFVLSVVFPSAL